MEKKSRKKGIYYLVGGIAGCAFLIGSYQENKTPMNNLWDAQSIGSTLLFLAFIFIGIYKMVKEDD